ncbi:MAG: HEAT repeat domain-containing protein [Candidatus Binataceae bacterium]
MLKMMLTSAFIAVSCVFASSPWAAQQDLAAADWSVKSPYSLATNPPSDDAMLALLNKLTPYGELHQKDTICSSRFADLRRSGNLSLVVSVGDGRFCYPSIIDKTASGFEHYMFQPHTGIEKIEDLAGNGNLEVIVDTGFTGYYGVHHCEAFWPVIYAWTGSGYTDVSSQYKGYYEQQLKSLNALPSAIEQAQAPAAGQAPEHGPTIMAPVPPLVTGTSSSSSNGIPMRPVAVPTPEAPSSPAATPAAIPKLANDCTEAEAGKIERFLGISRDAGMSDAIKWANSDDSNRRDFAAAVLADIGTPDAIEYLRSLSNDTNREVAGTAKIYLEAVGRGPALNTVQRVPLAESPPK